MAFDLSKAAFGVEAKQSASDRIRSIPLEKLRTNAKNFYSMTELETLADSIRVAGLLEPIRVVRDADHWRIISGHRRTAAWRRLAAEDPEHYEAIPALVMEDMDDLSETFALITANSTVRELTYGEKCRQEEELRKVLTAWKDAGKEVPKNLGQYIADQIGVSRNEVSRMHTVNEHLIPEAREKLDKGEMTAQAAYEMARRPEAEQKKAVSNLDTGAAETQRKAEGAAGTQRDAIGELSEAQRHVALLQFADNYLSTFCHYAVVGSSRKNGTDILRSRLHNRGARNGAWCYDGSSSKITFWNSDTARTQASWAELWDALAIAALERVSKLDTKKEAAPRSGAAWHTGDPTEKDAYVCMYKTPSGEKSVGILDWKGQWRKYGQPVGDVYKVEKWTEVPK